ncbi:hypothetical protein GQ457_07G028850 [Hibiscus cannabinus]
MLWSLEFGNLFRSPRLSLVNAKYEIYSAIAHMSLVENFNDKFEFSNYIWRTMRWSFGQDDTNPLKGNRKPGF